MSDIRRGQRESVIEDRDSRTQTTDTRLYPWYSICSLRIVAQDGTRWAGSGCLVTPFLVLTAGHCVYMHDNGGWARSIEVTPGCNGDQPFPSVISRRFRSVLSWMNGMDRNRDYGAIILPQPALPVGYRFFELVELDTDAFFERKVHVSGYPKDKPSSTQWDEYGPVLSVNDLTI